MNYIGSKKSLLPFLEESILSVVAGNSASSMESPSGNTSMKTLTFIDGFAGTGAVGQHFKKLGYRIIANDLQYYSYVLNKNYIENCDYLSFNNLLSELPSLKESFLEICVDKVCEFLTHLEGEEGFIYQNYCLGGTKNSEFERQYYSDENGKKTDAIRLKIEEWKTQNLINDGEYYFLLTSLLESIDSVANTASVYGAFLKKLKKSAQKPLTMKPATFALSQHNHKVYNQDIETLVTNISGDILYLDPPYNHRQYAPNYHLLETIARYDNPVIHGKTGLRDYAHQKSNFAIKHNVLQSFERIIMEADVRYVFVSYNNEGLMNSGDVRRIMEQRGKYGLFTKDYSRFKADNNKNRDHKANSVTEYLHYVICK